MTKYSVTTEGPDGRLPVLRQVWVAWRLDGKGQPEFRGVYASQDDAKADPAVAVPAVGWKVAEIPLVAWNAIALRGA